MVLIWKLKNIDCRYEIIFLYICENVFVIFKDFKSWLDKFFLFR